MFQKIILASVVALAASTNIHPREFYEKEFYDHVSTFKLKFINGVEFIKRLSIFIENFDLIEKHNSDMSQTYKLGTNQFAHLTFAEFVDAVKINGTIPNLKKNPHGLIHEEPKDMSQVATSVDWTLKGAVTDVKDQGSCGSCWSFSATGSLEGAYYLKYGSLQAFSEQQLVSCDTVDAGCNGGWMDDAFTFAQKNGGLATEQAYPYTSGTSGKNGVCKTAGIVNNANVAPKSFTDVQTGSVNALMSAVSQQPVSIAIQANQPAFQLYKSGVLTGNCGTRLDHGVLLVGFGTDASTGVDYWKVKNSWADTWGESGFIRIERSSADKCGVLDAPSYPNL
jgi:cathepsin L